MGQQEKEKNETDSPCLVFRSAGVKCSLVADIFYSSLALCGIRRDYSTLDIHTAYNDPLQ
jgi:hypothetical protein